MSNITLKEDELEAILAEVERDLAAVLKSESERLSKAVGDEDEDQAQPEGSAPAAEGSAPPMDAAPAEAPAEDAPAAPAAEASAKDDADDAAPQGEDQNPAEDQGDDMEALKGEYAALPLDELKMHYMAAKSALLEQMQAKGGDAEGSAPAGEKSAPPPAPAPEASASAPAMKSEKKAAATLSKAEEAKNQKIAELQAQVSGLAKAVELLVSTPQRKAVTSIAYLGKSEAVAEAPALSKSEIIEKLSQKAKDPKLSKNDRSLINKFCVEKTDVKSIEHLLR